MTFVKNQPRPKKAGIKKGGLHKKTIVKQRVGIDNWNQLADFIEGKGLKRYVQELQGMGGKDYTTAFNALSEFVKPKLSRTEVLADIKTDIHWNETKKYGTGTKAESGS